ncbi:MAG: hypothetical protein M3Y81_13880 [Chloroflexota bacterium]|nr:hypothetical protein [Chloroflexota bacterium]
MWVGEAGILTVVVGIVVIVLLFRISPLRQVLACPGHPLIAEDDLAQGARTGEATQVQ